MKLVKTYIRRSLTCARLIVDGNRVIGEIFPHLNRENFSSEEIFKVLNELDNDIFNMFKTTKKELRWLTQEDLL